MRDQYAGDVSDVLKFAFLRALAGRDRTLGMAWYYALGNDGRQDGRHLEWRGDAAWHQLDEELTAELSKLPERSVAALERMPIWPEGVLFRRQHVRDGVATLKTEKCGYTVEVSLPILPVLQKTLEAGPCGDLAFICGKRGHPLTKESFGNMFKDACRAAGVNTPKQSAHDLRKVAATRAAENGATEFELMAIFGWTDPKVAAHYVKTANRKRLAAQGMGKLNASGTSIPAPLHQVREKIEKG